MRKWYKYSLDSVSCGVRTETVDHTYAEHARSMGGYEIDESYNSQELFFKRYFTGYHWGRLESYDRFLRAHLQKNWQILSVRSGRCANEMRLACDGYSVTCSDLEWMHMHEATRRLFPSFKYTILDILRGPAPARYDAVIALSLIYLFNQHQLDTFFANVAASLRPGGLLLLDSAGSPDNLPSYLIHDVSLPLDIHLARIWHFATRRKWEGIRIKHFGYRRTDRDILQAAAAHGFLLTARWTSGYTIEFRRIRWIEPLIRRFQVVEHIAEFLGRSVPYIRMFALRKDESGCQETS